MKKFIARAIISFWIVVLIVLTFFAVKYTADNWYGIWETYRVGVIVFVGWILAGVIIKATIWAFCYLDDQKRNEYRSLEEEENS